MSYTQSAILGVGTNYDGSKFSYPVKRYTKLFDSKFGRTLLEQDNTDRCVATRLYQADKDGNKVTLSTAGYDIELPPTKAKALIDGGYANRTVVLGIRPEDVYDSQVMIETHPNAVIESTIKVYELLGAEVYLYFDLAEFPMTARVDPRTTVRTGDKVKFALDVEKIHVFDKETEKTITN